jgi:hypothetical protein
VNLKSIKLLKCLLADAQHKAKAERQLGAKLIGCIAPLHWSKGQRAMTAVL